MKLVYPEDATPLDPDESDALIPRHITTRSELTEWESRNIRKAAVWSLSRKRSDVLTAQFTRELHRRMFDQTWEWAGRFRQSDKNIGVPWEHIPVEIHKLLDDVAFWLEDPTWPVRESAIRLHHRMVKIHPFVNGNGRHARLMADVLLYNHHQPPIDWGGRGLDSQGDIRARYLNSLRAADRGEFGPLLAYAQLSDES
jgi:Fic-DOC domain mobile mystery protein B